MGNRSPRALLGAVAAVAGLLTIAGVVVATLAGVRLTVTYGTSMEPSLSAGTLLVTVPVDAADLHVGDLTAFDTPYGDRIVHRVVSVNPTTDGSGRAIVVTRGDNNPVADPPVDLGGVATVAYAVPTAGLIGPETGWVLLVVLVGGELWSRARRGRCPAPATDGPSPRPV